MYKWIRIIRPVNALMGFVATYISGLVGIGLDLRYHLLVATIAGLCVFLVISGGNIINDISDAESDRINHPNRPIPNGEINIRDAWVVSLAFFAVAAVLSGIEISTTAALVVIFAIAVLVGYETRMKGTGLPGNIAISLLVGLIFVFGGLAVNSISRMILLFLMAFFTNTAREIIKDIQDIKGDVDRKTFPKVHGIRASIVIIVVTTLTGIAFSILTFLIHVFGIYYFIAVIFADAAFIGSLFMVGRSPEKSQNFSKLGMIIGLVAFTVGGII